MFQIVLSELDRNGSVVACWPVHPTYELLEDAVAIAEFDALRLSEDGSLDESDDLIHTTDVHGRTFRIEVKEIPSFAARYLNNSRRARDAALG
jgi:hypothetical protein